MPKKVIDYANSVIYKLVPNDMNLPDCYIGSTTNFNARKAQHKAVCNDPSNKKYNTPLYQTIRAKGGFDGWDMVLVENFPCKNKQELHARERHQIQEHQTNLNKLIPTRTQEERYEIYRERDPLICACGKQYHLSDKARHEKSQRHQSWIENGEKKNEGIEILCDCGAQYHKADKARHIKSQRHQKFLQEL